LKKLLIAVVIFILIFPVVVTAGNSKLSGEIVAKLDGKVITRDDLEKYANMIPNDKYKKMLNTREGLKKLAELYIQRRILLEKAKKVITKKEAIFKSHGGKMNEDVAYLIAYLTKEIENKINITKEEIQAYMKKNNVNKYQAMREILSRKRRELFNALVENLKREHKIEFCINDSVIGNKSK